MQNEVYGNQGRDRISQTQQMVAQELNGVLSHLQNAEMTFEQRGVRAATGEYTAAIRAADSIDQQAVARERDNVRQMLQSQNLDAQTRRALVQEDADLHTLQRAPGFARANFALLMIRNGDQYYGTQLLLEAQQKDPEMNQDPNFQRHLKNAIDAAPRAQQQQGYDQQQQQQVPYDQRQQQQVPYDQRQQQQQPGDTQRQQVPQGDQTQQQNQRVSPLDAQNRSPVEAVQQMFGTVTGPGTMSPEVKQGFQQAIAAADAGQSPRMQALMQAEAQAAQAVRPLADQALVQKVTAQDQAAQTLIQQMTPDKQQAAFQLYNALDKSSTPAERQQIQQQLVALNPGLQQILQNRDQIMGAQNIQALMNFMQVENALQAEKNQQAITRFTYGMALAKNGDNEEAKKYIGDAIKLNNSTDPELKAFWQRTAASMGVPMDNTAPQTTTDQTGRQQQPQGDQIPAGTAAAALQAVEQKFQQVVAQKGDVKAAYQQLTPEFVAAQQKADAEFTALVQQTQARDQQLQAAIDAKLTPQVKAQLQQLSQQIDAEKAKLTPDAIALYNKYQDPSTSEADRQAIHAQLGQKAPNLVKLGDQLEQTVGKDTMMNIMTLAADHQKLQGALMGRFLTRYYLADTAATAGDMQNAQAQLGAAFQTVPQEFQQAFAQKPDVQALAQKVGIDLTKLPAPPDAVLAQAGGAAAPTDGRTQQPGQTGDRTQQPGATTDQSGNIAGLNPENQGLRPDQIMAKAQQALQQGGMTEATKKQFQDAIKSADALYGPQDKQMTDQLIQVLQTGKKADGSALSPQERVQAHQLVQQEFSRATLGMQYRMAYGSVLNQNKQYASAEAVFKENVAVADKLPLASFQAELTQLGKDSQNPQIDRASQADLFTMMQSIQGSGTSKDDGLLYMPITTRKQAALFYVAGADGSGNGLVKPEQAAAMIDQATAKEKELYGVTDDKLKTFDPTLANMAKGIVPLLPENIRKQKQNADSFWSNAMVDGGTAAVVLTLAGLTASIVTKNPRIFGMLVEGEGAAAKLSLTGYAAIGTAGLGLDIAGRHYVHQALTGENESWGNSAIHGVAGLGAVGAIMGTRSAAAKFLFRGATPEAAAGRMLTETGLTGEAATGKFVSTLTQRGVTLTPELKAMEGSLTPVMVDGALNPQLAAELGRLSPASLARITGESITTAEGAAAGAKWYTPSGFASRVAGANPFSTLDMANVTAGKLGMRSFYSGYTTALAGTGTYGSIAAMDRGVDPVTGKQMSYAESFMKTNFNSMEQNVFTEALMIGMMPVMKDGAIAKSVFQEGAGLKSNAWNAIKSPWSATTFGSMGTDALTSARYARTGLQAGQMAFVTTFPSLFNLSPAMKAYGGWQQSKAYGNQLDAMAKPITDQAAPTAAPVDSQILNQQTRPAGQTDAPVTPVQDNGQPIQDQPVDNQQQQTGNLTQGTPGLGG
ncbi:MAG: hypothetical protein JST89_15610 [Cyanobacteria bacterium SZAS-4]|nr:hypothetical protein [Cyanobacteria bacterium SZAS-4]